MKRRSFLSRIGCAIAAVFAGIPKSAKSNPLFITSCFDARTKTRRYKTRPMTDEEALTLTA